MKILPGSPQLRPAYAFTAPDELTTTDNALIPWIIGRGRVVRRARASVKVAPTGASITVAIKRYTLATGVVVDTLGTVTIAATAFTGEVTWAGVIVTEAQALAAEITQIGSTLPGENLSLLVD